MSWDSQKKKSQIKCRKKERQRGSSIKTNDIGVQLTESSRNLTTIRVCHKKFIVYKKKSKKRL